MEIEPKELIKVLEVDKDNCVNCHSCITVCPVKYCNDGSRDYVTLNSNMCIACGSCIAACTHNARHYIDDFAQFLYALEKKTPIVCLLTPSAAANFPEKYLHLNGWLKSIGVDAIFDVSFGAELTVKSYLSHIENNKPRMVIAQPCPAIVTYIQIYQPELIQYLAPCDSPIVHTIKMIRQYFPQYSGHSFAIVSPCSAKKREYQETGLGDYNLAFKSIDKHLTTNNIHLEDFPKINFDNPSAERAVMFSTPGGLLQTVERLHPEMRYKTRKIEGTNLIYDYLKKLPKVVNEGKAPLLLDCLNCEYGCNAGPLTLVREQSVDEIEYWVHHRFNEMRMEYLAQSNGNELLSNDKIDEVISKYWDSELYSRKYENLWRNVEIEYPNETELKYIYEQMHKYTEADLYNCSSCGYGTCERMATAIFNNLNRVENCHFYLSAESQISHKQIVTAKNHIDNILNTSLEGFLEANSKGVITRANPAMRNILKRNDIVGRAIFDFLDEENKQVLVAQLKLRDQHIQSSYQMAFTQSDGNQVICMISGSPLFDENNVRTGSFAMVSDISKLKAAEEELRKSNEQLEERVRHRTFELNESVEELSSLVEELRQQREEIIAQTEALEETQQQLNDIIEFLPDAVMVLDSEKRVVAWNKSMEELSGINKEEMIGKNDFEYAIPFYGIRRPILIDVVFLNDEEIKKNYQHVRRRGNTLIAETYVPNLSGKEAYLVGSASALYDIKGNISGAIEIIRNETERKKAEEKLNQVNAQLVENQSLIMEQNEALIEQKSEIEAQAGALMESEQRLSDIINLLPDPVLVVGKKGEIIFWNKSMEELTGIESSEMIGKGNYEYSLPFYGHRRPILVDLVQLSEEELSHNYKHISKTDRTLTAELFAPLIRGGAYLIGTASVLYNVLDEFDGAIEIIRDITIQKRDEEAIMEANTRLEEQQAELVTKSVELSETVEELRCNNEIIQEINSELEKLSIVARETDNAIVIMDALGNFIWVNESFTRNYGYTLDEYVRCFGGNLLEVSSCSNIKEIYDDCKNTKKSVIYESKSKHKSGENHWTQTTITPLIDEFGEISKLIAIDTDISKLKDIQFEVLQKKEEIEAQRDEIQRHRDELSVLIKELNLQKRDIQDKHDELQKQRDQIAKKNKQISDSIHYAKRIQQAIMPAESVFHRYFPESFILFKPKDVVSGDFYWIRRKGAKMYIAAADCTGHGVPGAIMSMLGLSFLNELINVAEKTIKADEILNQLRTHIVKSLHQKGKIGETQDGLDIAFCILDMDDRVIQFAGANSPMYIIRKDTEPFQVSDVSLSKTHADVEVVENRIRFSQHDDYQLIEIKGDKMPIGVYVRDNVAFTSNEVHFRTGDSIYMFSDGYASQFGGKNFNKFLTKNLKALLLNNQQKTMVEQKQILEAEFLKWKGNYEQVDDILIIGIKI